MFGISAYEAMIIAAVALIVVGPKRLPEYAKKFANFLKTAQQMFRDAQSKLKDETGVDAEDLRKYDPRQYDPRRILRDSLAEDPRQQSAKPPGSNVPVFTPLAPGEVAPFDDEAT